MIYVLICFGVMAIGFIGAGIFMLIPEMELPAVACLLAVIIGVFGIMFWVVYEAFKMNITLGIVTGLFVIGTAVFVICRLIAIR